MAVGGRKIALRKNTKRLEWVFNLATFWSLTADSHQSASRGAQGAAASFLTRSLSHLPALASEASHPLLAPLGTHATVNAHEQGHGVSLLDHGVQGAFIELGGTND